MGKITRLTSMFTRKTKVKVTTPAESLESEGIWEPTRQTLAPKDSDHMSQSWQKGAMAKGGNFFSISEVSADDEKSTMSAGNMSKKRLSIPSAAEWVKHEDTSSWTEKTSHACAEVPRQSHTELFEFDTRGATVINYDETESHAKSIITQVEVGEVVAEVAYEGDEDEELERAADSCVIQIENRSEGSGTGEHSPDEQRSRYSANNASATYYEFHSNVAHGSDVAASHYSEEDIGDYVSDPGVYHDDHSCVGPSDEDVEGGQIRTQSQNADHVLKKARSEGGLYELGLISQEDQCQPTDHNLVPVSQGSPSYLEVGKHDLSIRLAKSVVEGPRSEADSREAKSLYLNVSFPGKGPSVLNPKPWWKMSLISHRKVHGEGSGLIARSSLSRSDRLLISGATGYSSDVDYYSGSGKLEAEASYSESVRTGLCHSVGEVVEHEDANDKDIPHVSTTTDGGAREEESCFEVLPSFPALVHDKSGKDSILSLVDRPNMRWVEEWISSVDPTPFTPEEEGEITAYSDTECSAPAASFFRPRASHQTPSDGGALLDRRVQAGDVLPDADTEMAGFIARSVNPLSTVAHFSGVGLRLVPPLGVHNNLKTLNLSANTIVRIVPGCLPRSLHSLDLSRNKIVVIEGFRELCRLRVLNLSYNRILRIGHGLANCTSLRELHLAGNKVSEVEGLHRLLKLSFIDLGFNKLASGKSIGQLAANYISLQAINLLGNPLHSNLGEEQLRKLIIGIAPQVVYLNKQAMKPVSARDASVDSVARAALGTTSHHTHQRGKTSSQSKLLRQNGKAAASCSHHRHGEKRGGDKPGAAHGSRPSALKNNKTHSELPSRHRHSQSRHVLGTGLMKEGSRPLVVPPPLSLNV